MRCKRHSLACGPDGLCVLCRRDAPSKPPPRPFALPALLVGAVVLVSASALAYRVATARRAALAVAPLVEPVTPSIGPLPEPATSAPVAVASDDQRSSNALARQAALHSFEEALAAADGAPVDSVVATAPSQEPEPEASPPRTY